MSSEEDMSESLGDAETSELTETETETETNELERLGRSGFKTMRMITEDNVSYARTHMWQLLKQLEDIKDMADLVGIRFSLGL
jgi:hypothetical protein